MARASFETLLNYLEARVHAKGGSLLKGTVCVGVRGSGRCRWWIADFGRTTTTHFADELPVEFDAGIAMDTQTALWIIGSAPKHGRFHITTGDISLLESFNQTFLKSNSVMSLRMRGVL